MKLKKNKLLSFDLDMTLVDDETGLIPQSALDAIASVRENYYIVIATGRDMTLKSNQPVLEKVQPDACVHNNGTQVHIDGNCVYFQLFDKAILRKLLEFGLAHKICVCAVVDNIQYSTNPQNLEPLQKILSGADRPVSGNPMDLLNLRVQTLGLAGSEEDARLLRGAFPQLKIANVIPGIWYDIMEPDVSKKNGMEIVLEHYGLTMKDVIAFGDSMNDYELLEAAGYAVAMGNASEKLKQIADLVTDPVNQDGIARALNRLCR